MSKTVGKKRDRVSNVLKFMVDHYILSRMKTADIIMIGTHGSWISNIIKSVTNSEYSHTGIYIGKGLHIHASYPKVKISSVYSLVTQMSYRAIAVYRVENLIEFDRNKVIETAWNHIGAKYDWVGLLGHLLATIFPKMERLFISKLHRKADFYCSEYLGNCYRKIGIEFGDKRRYQITPEDIVQDSRVERVMDLSGE